MQVSSVRETRRLYGRAMTEYGVPDQVLMENAEQAVYYVVLRRLARGDDALSWSADSETTGSLPQC